MKKLEACHANRCDPVQSNLDKTARLQSDHASPSSVNTLVVQRSEGTRFHCNGRAERIMATSAGESCHLRLAKKRKLQGSHTCRTHTTHMHLTAPQRNHDISALLHLPTPAAGESCHLRL